MADRVSLKTLALAKSFVKATADALGAVKGAPCTVKSVEAVSGGQNVTYEWTGTSGTKQTRTVFFPNGIGIKDAYIDASENLILVRDDDTEIVVGTLPSGYDGAVVYKVDSLPTTGIDDTALYIYNGVIYEYDSVNGKWVEVLSGGSGDSTEYEFDVEGTNLTVTDTATGIKQSLPLPTSSAGGITSDLPVTIDVGGIKKPKTYPAGTSVEQIFNDLLNPVVAPTIVAPKATLTSNASRFIYGFDENIGSVQFILAFSRGSISTGGYRAGEATGYQIDGKSGQNVTINMDEKTGDTISITGAVSYGEGDIPKDSAGNPSGTALPAGSLNSNAITFQKKPYIYTTKSGAFERMPIAQYNASPLAIALANGDGVSSPVCKVALPAQAKSIEVRNELTNQFVNNRDEFDETTETIDGRTYYVYTDNRGTRSGERDLRFTF